MKSFNETSNNNFDSICAYIDVGLHPAGLHLPSFKTEDRAQSSNRAINGLMNAGAYTFEARSWSDTPPCAAEGSQAMVAAFAPGGNGRLPVIGELKSGGLISYQGNQRRGMPFTAGPFHKNNH